MILNFIKSPSNDSKIIDISKNDEGSIQQSSDKVTNPNYMEELFPRRLSKY